MNRKFVVIKNSSIGLLSQLITIVFAFVTRDMFIRYMGLELLGMNSTFTSVLNALSLSELGFEAAVVYSLYRPMHENDIEKINEIINILKVIYRCIGIIFVLGSFSVLPFLQHILVDVNLDKQQIYIFFLLQASASVCSYFLAYKRTLLYVDQKEYISKAIDMAVNCLLNIVQCITIAIFHSYSIYLLLKFAQILISNVIIHVFCTRYYSYLHKGRLNKAILKDIVKNVKNIFVGRIAGLVYISTDSLVISAFINTVSVAYYGNYMVIISNLKNLTRGLFAPIMPIVGNYLAEEENNVQRENIFLLYTHIRFWFALIIVAPTIVLIDDLIKVWLGAEYILPSIIINLFAIEFYIDLVHSSTVDYINGMGLFKLDKYIELLGAATNVIFSIIMVRVFGLSGVIAGTVLSQCLFWIGRSGIVYFKGMYLKKRNFLGYWIRNTYYLLVFIVSVNISRFLYSMMEIDVSVIKILMGGLLCEIAITIVGVIMLFRLKEQRRIVSIVKELISDIVKRIDARRR